MPVDSSVSIQPAAQQGASAPATIQLRLEMVPDPGSGTSPPALVAVQTFVLQDDQGRSIAPMTEDTGQRICRLLARLIRVTIDQGGILTDEEAALTNT